MDTNDKPLLTITFFVGALISKKMLKNVCIID